MNTTENISWPPPYSVRRSQRARRLQLKIIPEVGLEIVVPQRAKNINYEELLSEHREWILQRLPDCVVSTELPEKFELRAIGQTWQINFMPTDGKLRLLHNREYTLTLIGDVTDKNNCQRLLTNWLKKQARLHLGLMLDELSALTNLAYRELSIRNQKTRWGSCSIEGNITLNVKLLFLPPELARHIIIHELCHTKFLDHSKQFWQLVQSFDPHTKQHRRQLNQLSNTMNSWGVIKETDCT